MCSSLLPHEAIIIALFFIIDGILEMKKLGSNSRIKCCILDLLSALWINSPLLEMHNNFKNALLYVPGFGLLWPVLCESSFFVSFSPPARFL